VSRETAGSKRGDQKGWSMARTLRLRHPAPGYRLVLFGPFTVYCDGIIVDTRSWQQTAVTLLKLLATARGWRRSRDELIDILWPESGTEAGSSSLRSALLVLRRGLGGELPSPILYQRGWMELNRAYDWEIDLQVFEEELRTPAEAPSRPSDLLALYRGAVLPEDRYDDWAAAIRDRTQHLWRDAVLRSVYPATERSEALAASECLTAVLETDPYDEEALRALLEALVLAGRRTEALQRYQLYAHQLRTEMELAPDPETLALADRIKVQTPQDSATEPDGAREEPGRAVSAPVGGFLGALPIGPLVGRREELERLLTAVDGVVGGRGHLVVLVGEAGVGKTRLAQEVMLALRDRGFLVAGGRCYEPRQTLPYYPFLDALTMAYESAPSTVRGQASRRWPPLASLLPDQLGQPPAPTIGFQDEQQRLFRAVTAFLVSVAESMPVALLLDDLHWADSASLDLLQHLARHARASSTLLLGTYRDIDLGPQHPLERALRDLNREGLLERLPVRRLNQEGTAALIAANVGQKTAPSEFSALVHRHTEGNPFFIREVLRALMERGDIHQTNGGWEYRGVEMIEVPESVRSTIAERVSRLSERAQGILHEASVLGQTFSFGAVQAMSVRAEEEIEGALGEATATGLVRETGGEGYSFNHALTQQTLYAELSGRRKRHLHLAAGEALERLAEGRRREQLAELAWHLLRGGQPARALPYSLLAGDAAEQVFAHAEAEQHYRTALELARELGDREHEAEVLEKLGGVLRIMAQHDHAVDLLMQAAEVYRAVGDREAEGRVEAEIGMAHFARGTSDEGSSRLQPRLLSLEGHVSLRVLCSLYEAQSQLFFGTSQYREHLESAERWVQAAQKTGDTGLLARARGRYGTALQALGRVEESIAVHEEAIALAEAAGETYALMYALNDLAEGYQMGGALDTAMVLRERHLEVTRQMGYEEETSLSLCGLAQTLVLLGEWAATLMRSQTSWFAAGPPLTLAELSLLEGDRDAAPRFLAEGMVIAERNKALMWIRLGQLTQAQLDLANGQPEAAVARLEPLVDRPGLEETLVTCLLPVLAEGRLELAHDPESLQQAAGTVDQALRRARAQNNRVQLVHALRVHGMLLAGNGHVEEAENAFQEAISLASSMPYPYAEARTLYEYSMLSRAQGEHLQAQAQLREALTIFTALGARSQIERTAQALVAMSPEVAG
jgi:DNA-binding SARP family transcriptional activator/tetratricopeptide (TPR) repeat protein